MLGGIRTCPVKSKTQSDVTTGRERADWFVRRFVGSRIPIGWLHVWRSLTTRSLITSAHSSSRSRHTTLRRTVRWFSGIWRAHSTCLDAIATPCHFTADSSGAVSSRLPSEIAARAWHGHAASLPIAGIALPTASESLVVEREQFTATNSISRCAGGVVVRFIRSEMFGESYETMLPNHALQRTRPSHRCCNRGVPRAGS
jgi:hypothetical protein